MNKLIEILSAASKGALSEQLITQIAALFNETVTQTVNDKVALAVEAAVKQNDDANVALLKEAIKDIDRDRAKKMTHLLIKSERIKEKALTLERKKLDKYLKEDAKKFKEELISRMDVLIEKNIDKMIPADIIKEAALNTEARTALKEVREFFAIKEGSVHPAVKKAIETEKQKTELALKALDEAKKEVKSLKDASAKKDIDTAKAQKTQLIESKLATVPVAQRESIRKVLETKTLGQINENFTFIAQQVEASVKREADTVTEEQRAAAREFRVSKMKLNDKTVIAESAKAAIGESTVTTPPSASTEADKMVEFMRPLY